MYNGKILNWCLFKPEQLERILDTDLESGLTKGQASSRISMASKAGTEIGELLRPFAVFFKELGRILSDFSVLLFLVASVICAIITPGLYGAVAVTLIFAFCCALLRCVAELYGKGNAKGSTDDDYYTVIRDGKPKKVKGSSVVCGDVVRIVKGDVVPCDMRLIKTFNLNVIEKYDNKRVMPTLKDAQYYPVSPAGKIPLRFKKNMLFKGSAVTNGEGYGVVLDNSKSFEDISEILGFSEDVRKVFEFEEKTGYGDIYTRITGKSAFGTRDINEKKYSDERTVKANSERLMAITRVFGLLSGTLVLVLSVASRMLITDAFLYALALMACAPSVLYELCITLALFAGKAKLKQQGVYLRDFESAEKLALSKSVLLCGSTGYRIEKMHVSSAFFGSSHVDFLKGTKRNSRLFFELLLCACDIEYKTDKNGKASIVGDLEGEAVIEGASKFAGITENMLREYIVGAERLYDSSGALSGSLIDVEGSSMLVTKGSVSSILPKCDRYIDDDGAISQLSAEIRSRISKYARECENSEGCRVVALCGKRQLPYLVGNAEKNEPPIFIGLAVFSVTVSTDGAEYVKALRTNGIKPVIFSGEASDMVISNSRKLGVLGKDDNYITSRIYASLDEKIFSEDFESYTLFMNMDGAAKREIILRKKRSEGVVAAAVDRTVDAFDMSESDVLISFGKDAPKSLRRISDIHSDKEGGTRTICKIIRICRNMVRAASLATGFLISAQCSAMVFCLLGVISSFVNGGVYPMGLLEFLVSVFITDLALSMLTAFIRTPRSILSDLPQEFYSYYEPPRILPKALISGLLCGVCTFLAYLFALVITRSHPAASSVAFITLYASKSLVSLFCVMTTSTAKAPAPTPVSAILSELILGVFYIVAFCKPMWQAQGLALIVPIMAVFAILPSVLTRAFVGLNALKVNSKHKK